MDEVTDDPNLIVHIISDKTWCVAVTLKQGLSSLNNQDKKKHSKFSTNSYCQTILSIIRLRSLYVACIRKLKKN